MKKEERDDLKKQFDEADIDDQIDLINEVVELYKTKIENA